MRHSTRALAALAAAVMVAAATTPAPAQSATIGPGALSASPDLIAAPDDFSSTYRGYWWDFEDQGHFAAEESRVGWDNPRLLNGWWVATSLPSRAAPDRSDGTVRLSHLNIDGYPKNGRLVPEPTNWEPAEHRYTPFDPAYRFLTIRMCSSAGSKMMVRWHRNASFVDRDYGGANYKTVLPGCRVYSFDLVSDRNPGVGDLAWDREPMYALEVLPVVAPGITVRIDYVTLGNRQRGAPVTIRWDPVHDPMTLLFSSSPDGSLSTRVAGRLTGGEYRWRTPNLPPGTYYLSAVSGTDRARLTGPVLTVDAPPQGRILDPGYTAGPDYAAEVVGNPWDMSDPADIEYARQVSDALLRGGIYYAASLAAPNAENPANTGDPGLFLHITDPIDPDRYRYLTWRVWVEGEGVLQGTGGVARVYWYNDPKRVRGSWSYTQDVRVYKGWRTVSIDLATAYLEGEDIGPWGSYPVTDLRLDPHESGRPRRFQVDWVTLTGDVVADRLHRIRYLAEDPDGPAPTVRFFYDTDRDPEGAMRLRCRPDARPPGGPGESCAWRTVDLEPAAYFVHILLTDAAGNRTWVTSDTPVLVRHR